MADAGGLVDVINRAVITKEQLDDLTLDKLPLSVISALDETALDAKNVQDENVEGLTDEWLKKNPQTKY